MDVSEDPEALRTSHSYVVPLGLKDEDMAIDPESGLGRPPRTIKEVRENGLDITLDILKKRWDEL